MLKIFYKGNIYLCIECEEKRITDDDVTVYEKMFYFDKDKFARVQKILAKEDAYLLRIRKNIYVDIDDIVNLTDLCNLLFIPKRQDYVDLIYSLPSKENDLFIRKKELKPIYIDMNKVKKEIISKVKK